MFGLALHSLRPIQLCIENDSTNKVRPDKDEEYRITNSDPIFHGTSATTHNHFLNISFLPDLTSMLTFLLKVCFQKVTVQHLVLFLYSFEKPSAPSVVMIGMMVIDVLMLEPPDPNVRRNSLLMTSGRIMLAVLAAISVS